MARRHSTRERVLTLLAREREVYNRRTREYERVPETLGRVAKKIGVSIRTARRWKNEGVEPGPVSARAADRLAALASKVSRSTADALARDREKHPRAMKIPRAVVPVLPRGHRRQLREYGRDERGNVKATGRTYESSWINYNVRGWRFAEVLALASRAWRGKKTFQFIYEVPAGGQLPKSGDKPARTVRKNTKAATAPIDPYSFTTEADLAEFLNQYVDLEEGRLSRRMLYIAVDDNHAHRSRDDEGDEDEGEE